MDEDNWISLLKAFVEHGFEAYDDDRPCCFYCDVAGSKPHDPTCLWLRARAYLRDNGVEVESED